MFFDIEKLKIDNSIAYISFDVYDTLIQRIIPVEKIYNIIEEKCKIADFKNIRMEAERNIKKQAFNIYDIYNAQEFKSIKEEYTIEALKMEIELEKNNVVPRRLGKKMIEKLPEKVKIICISDMYFDKNTISYLLKKCGYYKIEKVYVSSDYNESKRNGKLYEIVLNDLKINKNEIMHIGDALRSDYMMPKTKGIKSLWIGKNNIENSRKVLDDTEYLAFLGYYYFGPLIYEFIQKVHENQKEQKYFLAREGIFIKECYEIMFEDENNKTLYLSRKSVLSGVVHEFIKQEKVEDLINMMSKSLTDSGDKILKRLGINYSGNTLRNEKDVCKYIYKNKEKILSETKEKSNLFDKYLKENIKCDGIFIDIGWNGSMQNIIKKYFEVKKVKIDIKGIYLGINNKENDKNGFLFEQFGNDNMNVMNYSGLLETIFMPNIGSVVGYKEEKNIIVPIHDTIEFDERSMQKIELLQRGMKEFIADISKITKDKSIFSNSEIIEKVNKIGLYPSQRDIKILGTINFYDNGIAARLIEGKHNLKRNFLNSKWKTGFLKSTLKLPIKYEKILNFMRIVRKNRSK